MNNTNKRERLIDSAAVLFHQNGLNITALADIAKHADIPIGNVYYYFKTKQELALAAITKRREQFSAAYNLLDENIADPRERLVQAVKYYDTVRADYARYGCPVGKMIDDLDTEKDDVAKMAANIFSDFMSWSEKQFKQLGHENEARTYATTLLTSIQGAVLVAKAMCDQQLLSQEMSRITNWLEQMPNKRIPLGKAGFKLNEQAVPA